MKNKKESLKPNWFWWKIYSTYSYISTKLKYHVKYDDAEFKNRNKSEGCIIIYNHVFLKDHFVSSGYFRKTRVNFVITQRFCFNKTIRWALKRVSAIPRDQFKNDLPSILKMKKVVSNGGALSISPAGQMSIDGSMPFIHPAIVKLLKLCKVDVYCLQTHGSYFVHPKWANNDRKYPLNVKIVKVLSKQEVSTLSNEVCYDKVVQALDVNDRIDNKILKLPIKGKKLAEGLEKILYICPKCGSKYTIKTSEDKIYCSSCNNTVYFNPYGGLIGKSNDFVCFDNEALWYNYQQNVLYNKMKNESFKLESKVEFYRNLNDQFVLEHVGDGVLYFDGHVLYYDGLLNGNSYHKDFDISKLYQFPFEPAVRFNIPDEEGWFEFKPENKYQVVEWVQSIIAYAKIRDEKNVN